MPKNKVGMICLSAIFFSLLLVSIVLQNAWYAYVILSVVYAGLLFMPRLRLKVVYRVLACILSICLVLTSLILCRSDMRVSFSANLYRSYQRLIRYTYNAVTGDTLNRNAEGVISEQYDFESRQSPKGYEQTEILLANARGYFLQKEGGDHESVVYYVHGGAYMMKYAAWYNDIVCRYSAAAGDADAFALDYRTAPENPYPAALQDAVDGYEYLLAQGYDPDRIVVAGDSAGGGLSVALTMYLRDHAYPMFHRLVLSSPWTDLTQTGDSYTENCTVDILFGGFRAENVPSPPLMPYYVGSDDAKNPYISPVFGSYEGFPATLIIAGEDEMLLSDSVTAYEKIKESGGVASLIVKHGMWHCYFILFPWCTESEEAWDAVERFLQP